MNFDLKIDRKIIFFGIKHKLNPLETYYRTLFDTKIQDNYQDIAIDIINNLTEEIQIQTTRRRFMSHGFIQECCQENQNKVNKQSVLRSLKHE
jgi:hypothetical protein